MECALALLAIATPVEVGAPPLLAPAPPLLDRAPPLLARALPALCGTPLRVDEHDTFTRLRSFTFQIVHHGHK